MCKVRLPLEGGLIDGLVMALPLGGCLRGLELSEGREHYGASGSPSAVSKRLARLKGPGTGRERQVRPQPRGAQFSAGQTKDVDMIAGAAVCVGEG